MKDKSACTCQKIAESCASATGPLLDTREVAFVIVHEHSSTQRPALVSAAAYYNHYKHSQRQVRHAIPLSANLQQFKRPYRPTNKQLPYQIVRPNIEQIRWMCSSTCTTFRRYATGSVLQSMRTLHVHRFEADITRVLHAACRGSSSESRSMPSTIPRLSLTA